MPLYDYQCPIEGCAFQRRDVFFRLADFLERIFDFCPIHGHRWFDLILSVPAAVHDWGNNQEGRYFEHTSHEGNVFSSRKQFRQFLKANRLREEKTYG